MTSRDDINVEKTKQSTCKWRVIQQVQTLRIIISDDIKDDKR